MSTELYTEESSAALRPVSPDERIAALDVIRGFALLGVLIAYTMWNLGGPPEESFGRVDRVLNQALAMVVDTKCYTLFAFLFGLGFSIQMLRAEDRGTSAAPTYIRRLLGLLVIGLVHALLLRNGDILVPYAVMGFALLAFKNASDRTLAVGAIVGLVWQFVAREIWVRSGFTLPSQPQGTGVSYLAENVSWVRYWYSSAIFTWPGSLPMFLFGLYVGRSRVFEDIASHKKAFRAALVVGLVFGIGALLVRQRVMMGGGAPVRPIDRAMIGLLWSAHAWGLAAFYASSVSLLILSPRWARWFSPVGAVGRMALSNYLLQAAIVVPVCLILGLFDKVTPTIGAAMAAAIWAFQVPMSVWWLNRFRFGPAEWLWRSMTYGKPQPMRIRELRAVVRSGN